jgi:hypothetical protein
MELVGLQDFFHIILRSYSGFICLYCTQKMDYLGRRMHILSIIGQVSLLASLFIMLGLEFSFPITGIPSAFMLLCTLTISFLTGVIGLAVGFTYSFKSGVVKAEFIALMGACIIPIALVQVTLGLQNISFAEVNDLTTNVENPPMFNQSRDRRILDRDTSVFWESFLRIKHSVKSHPNLQTAVVSLDCETAARKVHLTFHYLGWLRSFSDSTANSIEARASWAIGRRVNDFLVRLTPSGKNVCMIDLRSASRHDRRDLGVNLLLLDRFMDRFTLEFIK